LELQVMKKETIIQYLSNRKPEFEKKFGVTNIGLFGSYARGQQRKNSDIDIVVELRKPDLLLLVGIKQRIEEDLNMKVDIVRHRDSMNRTLKKRIEQDAIYA
jgi:predicted nucleotidyltransferase